MPESEVTAPIYQGLDQLILAMTQVDQGLQGANAGGVELKEKTELLLAASQKIATSNTQIEAAANQLLAANKSITPVITQLKEGAKAYTSGVDTFTQGVSQFKSEGVDTLIEEVESALSRVEAFKGKYNTLKEVSDQYNSFSNDDAAIDGSVIFILKTDAVK